MSLLHYLPLTLLIPLLSGCEPKVEPAKVAPEKHARSVVVEKQAVASPPPAARVAEAPQVRVSSPTSEARPKVASPEASTAVKAPPKTKLDLSLPPELVEQLQAEDRGTEPALAPLLPSLFEEKRPVVNPFQLNGRLITNERDEDYWNSVEGAEVQFEFRR